MSDEEDKAGTGDTTLFAIFLFAILALGLIPVTIWRVSTGAGATGRVYRPWEKRRRGGLRQYRNRLNYILSAAWALLIALGILISMTTLIEAEAFDPFEILGIEQTADPAAIKKAYRQMSKKWHPDKEPDPEQKKIKAKFFAEKLGPAYKTLTDDTARDNWLKHGHPDGPQAMSIGVALPKWIFAEDKRFAPLVLLVLAFLGLCMPILLIALYLWQTEGFVGNNRVSEETVAYYHRFGVREMLRLPKVPEQISPTKEFMALSLKPTQASAFQSFVNSMRKDYSLESWPKWWPPEVLRSYLFMMAYFDRRPDKVPAALQEDFKSTLKLAPVFCEEFVKASVSAKSRAMRGWFVPAEAAVQMEQCLVQQIKLEARAASQEEKKKKKGIVGEAACALLQLPGVEEDTLRALDKAAKIRTLEELAKLEPSRRTELLTEAGVGLSDRQSIERTLLSLPHAQITKIEAFVDGEDDIKEQDLLTVQVWVAITRAGHRLHAKQPAALGKAPVAVNAPRYPHQATERWHAFLANPKASSPNVWVYQMYEFLEAESAGFQHQSELGCRWAGAAVSTGGNSAISDGSDASTTTGVGVAGGAASTSTADSNGKTGAAKPGKAKPIGQKLVFKFPLPEAGKFSLSFIIMPSCWLGCDVSEPLNITVAKQTAEEAAGKKPRGAKPQPAPSKAEGSSSDDDDDDSSAGTGESDDDAWDTDETGTDVTHESEPEDEPAGDTKAADKGKSKAAEPKKKK